MGLLERHAGEVRLAVVKDTKASELKPQVWKNVERGAVVSPMKTSLTLALMMITFTP